VSAPLLSLDSVHPLHGHASPLKRESPRKVLSLLPSRQGLGGYTAVDVYLYRLVSRLGPCLPLIGTRAFHLNLLAQRGTLTLLMMMLDLALTDLGAR
jgi:hypothetical protein